ncbi:MetQ/NlpA family ABC transporter substrate-binding protein [Arenibaculum pallidiluteum]|uniref:MetQ/NlpA family ABC transporter substrate-binding protein n=1 Tax=Arenibaculum pallidiluteum TaxID=2812559 RepID=UPI001A97BEA1|nr:MetQ/NlpA family ABC transporter substrate-binding protein [Arenibaculum pallidiluteum]
MSLQRKLPALAAATLAATLALAGPLHAAERVKIGVTPGPHAQIMEQVKPIAARNGVELEIVEFSDYVVPNAALASGDIQANSFQHEPYLDNQKADRGYDIVSVAKTVIFPMGVYSKKVKSLGELPEGARVAVPNDPTNGGRALLLLQAQGLLELRKDAGLKATPIDIAKNPKKLRIVELDAAQLPRSLDDVDAAVVNTNYAMESGLDPNKDAIARESAESPYANLIAVRGADAGKPWVKALVESYHSAPVKQFVAEKFKGAVVTAW